MGELLKQTNFLRPLFIAGTGLVTSLVYLVAMRSATNGAMAAPLDDAYIYFQYARTIAEGHPFSYTEGAAPTTGTTGLLYPLLLVPAFYIGFDGDGIVGYAFALNTLFLMLVAPLVFLLARLYVGHTLATAAGLLTAIAGPVLWGFLSLMEVGLMALVVALVAYFFSLERWTLPPWRTLLTAAVLPFCRPEGALMALFVVGILITGHVYTTFVHPGRPVSMGQAKRTRTISGAAVGAKPWLRPVNLVVFLPIVAVVVYLLSLWLIADSFTTDTFVSKAIQYRPQLPWYEKVGFVLTNAAHLLQDPFGLSPAYLPVVILPIAGLGLARQVGEEADVRFPGVGILGLGLFLISVLSNSQSVGALLHHYRYIIPLFPLAMVFLAIGFGVIGRLHQEGRYLTAGASAILALLMVLNTGRWVQIYAENVRDIHYQQVHMGRWVDENLPDDVVVGINDAGAMAYYGNRQVYDLIGLVSEGASLPHRNDTGATFERILSLPPEERPDYLAIYPDWFEFPPGRFLTEIYRSHLHRITIASGDSVVVYQLDYSVTEGAMGPELDHGEAGVWELVDSLNSAHLEDEALHGYQQFDLVPRGGLPVTLLSEHVRTVNPGRHLIDGGRVVLGAEEFNVATRQGEDLKVVIRTNPLFATRLRVYADGEYVGDWLHPAGRGPWMEPSFIVPGRSVSDGTTRLRLELDTDRTDQDYAPFHYWFYQRAV